MEELKNKQRTPYFTRTEELDFQGLCRLHRFKKREVVKDAEGSEQLIKKLRNSINI